MLFNQDIIICRYARYYIFEPSYYYYKDLFTHKYKNTYINGLV